MAFSGDGITPLRAPALLVPPLATQRRRGSVKQQQRSAIVFYLFDGNIFNKIFYPSFLFSIFFLLFSFLMENFL
jgi:hypothetical protein